LKTPDSEQSPKTAIFGVVAPSSEPFRIDLPFEYQKQRNNVSGAVLRADNFTAVCEPIV
jgi:hypothetical protein